MISIVIADDQGMVRAGFRSLLATEPDVRVVGEAPDGERAVEVVRRTDPDVVLMDIRMPVLDGIAATRELVRLGSRARVLVLTTFDLDEYVFEALRAGAAGFLLKQVRGSALVTAVRTVAAGGTVAPEGMRPHAAVRGADDRLATLTDQERIVLRLIGEGLTNRQIGDRMGLAEKTVKNYTSHLLAKLGLERRTQAAILATELRDPRSGAR